MFTKNMSRSTVHYADNKTNNALKKLHNKLRPAGTPVQRVEYIIELLLLRIFETKIKQDEEFRPLRKLFSAEYKWKNPKKGADAPEETNVNRLFSYLPTVSNDQILSELNDNFFPFYSSILNSARQVFEGNLPQKVQDQLVLIEEVFSNSNFTNNVNSGNLGEVISIVANDIEEARLLKTDLLGDAIESALSETGGTKDVGLFRTPDHIRQFMTAMIEPTFDDIIFDPACGTGGFLFDAFEFVMRRVDPNREWPGEKAHSELSAWFDEYFKVNQLDFPSIEQTTQFYRSGVTGIEYLGMIRKMAAINFYVRGLNPANIEQGDSLAKYRPVTDHKSKSVILANPPFGAQRDQESYPDVWGEYSKESETTILFVKLMFEQLIEGGKCAVVVSEGFHAWDQFSAKALRKMLLDEAQLKAVISLPQGLFVSKSGQGPKTSILIFEKGGKTDWTWFYKITNDGYTMGTNRKEQKGNQLIECLTLWHEYVKHGKQPPETKNQFCIPADWIKTLDPRIKEKIRTETRADMETKGKIEREKKEAELDKKIKAKKATEADKSMELKTFDQMLENRIQNEIAKRIDKAHNYSFNLANYKSAISESQIVEWTAALKHIQSNGATTVEEVYKKLTNSKPENILPYLVKLHLNNALEADIAREYVSNLDNDLIAKHKELNVIKEILKSGAKYPMVKLKDYLILNENKIKPNKNPNVTYKVLGVSNEVGIFLNEKLQAEETNQNYFVVAKNEFCYNPYRINVGSIGLNTNDYDNQIISGAYIVFACKEDELNPKYLDTLFKSKGFLNYVNDKANGGVRMNFKFEYMEAWEIPLPSLDEQNAIVAKIEKQKAIIDGTEKIVSCWSVDIDSYLSQYDFSQKPISDLIVDSLYGSSEKADYQQEGYNVLRIGNIGFCDFKLNNIKKSVLSEKDFKKYELKKGDFLIVRSNGNPNLVGKCAVWDSDLQFIYASYLIRFRFKSEEINPRYVMYFLMSEKGRNLLTPTAGGGTYNISATDFQKVQISYPSPEIQTQIVAELDAQMEVLKGLLKMKSEAQKKINQLLADAWGVEFVEPVEEEIKAEVEQ
ncbi:N-6 DNA methylase [Pedobacter sp. KR3-3]|uniref:site-specific DNA-methyltransferase (adenine-specific) n=1 Tax=Pedobacter albus TaxID=3113905 RepID=A0ABU7I643_9SPHI|nr:N-6 DNA methylase [Pedobacter sp. KR3-3]MEE1944724.1 N-6 DNA methylase [Pedobacter sp. KR3-3]